MNFKDVVLSEISQVQKDKYCIIHLHKVPRKGKFKETESQTEIPRSWEEGGMEVSLNSY